MRYIAIIILSLLINNLSGQTHWLIDKNGCKVHNPYPKKGESVLWTGDCEDSLANGKGKLIWYLFGFKTKNVFDGSMINGKTEGIGKYTFSDGTILQGTFKNGYFYEGTRIEKIGKDTFIYNGKFIDNQINGFGELVVEDSYVFKGDFKDGYPTKGIEKYKNGDYFEGEFKDGYYLSGKFVSEIEGYSIESDNWKNFTALSGKLIFSDSTIYIGELNYTIPEGKGKMIFTNGDCFEGEFKNGKPKGKGKYTFSNGIIYKATWINGLIEGKGEILYPDGKKTIGIWKNNELIDEINGT